MSAVPVPIRKGGGILPIVVAFVGVCPVFADGTSDKSSYHLLNPVPRERLREMSTDRPDQTESPYTVDAGHFQVEADFVALHRHDVGDLGVGSHRLEGASFGAFNLKAGLVSSVDVQLLFTPWQVQRTEYPALGLQRTERGAGDLETRLKWNLWGNDGGQSALALMPYVKWPTAPDTLGNGEVEGGLIVPMAVELPGGWGLGLQTGVDVFKEGANTRYEVGWMNSVTLGHDLVGKLAGYVEFFSVTPLERTGDLEAFLDFGFTYGLTPDVQLDAGCNFGLTDTVPEAAPFLGISIRF